MQRELLTFLLENNEPTVREFLVQFLHKYYFEDDIIVTQDYILALGNIPVALVAHTDTVCQESVPKDIQIIDDNYVFNKNGILGADDRAGVYAVAATVEMGYRPTIIFTSAEEKGAIGASVLVRHYKVAPRRISFIMELDRRGQDDCVYYECGNKIFQQFIESFGFEHAHGTFSDISEICPAWDIAGVNLSVGYEHEHTPSELLNIANLERTIERVSNILDYCMENPDIEDFLFCSTATKYTCDCCGDVVEEWELIPLFKNIPLKDNCLVCADCYFKFFDGYGEDEGWI